MVSLKDNASIPNGAKTLKDRRTRYFLCYRRMFVDLTFLKILVYSMSTEGNLAERNLESSFFLLGLETDEVPLFQG